MIFIYYWLKSALSEQNDLQKITGRSQRIAR